MDVEVLHAQAGDKKKKIDTSTEAGRQEAEQFVTIQIRKGTALFLERGGKTYRIQGYDPKTDSLRVVAEVHAKDVPDRLGPQPESEEEVAARMDEAVEQVTKGVKGRKKKDKVVKASSRKGRVSAVAPVSGGAV